MRLSSTQINAYSVIITASSTNSGIIYVGDSSVTSSNGVELKAGEALSISARMAGRSGNDDVDLSQIWIDASSSGSAVRVAYIGR